VKLFQVNYQNRQLFVIAASIGDALQAARENGFEDDPVWIGLVAAEGQNLVVQIGYALQPAAVH